MANKITDLTDEELAKQEEEQNLAEIEDSIDAVILRNKNSIAELNKQISEYIVYDQDDHEGKLYLLERRNSLLNTVDEWAGYKDSPYFGRMDLVCNGPEPETFFVGEKGIGEGDKLYVLDWRTPVGSAFYNKQETQYTIKDIDYKLILRRAVNIKEARVIDVHTEYDDGSLSLDGEVIDPFLLSVLRDKRRNYKLTDIIRTIQGNQNELIRKPIEESFIVQGCAGSGKTMILLHRLSYIAFNYPNFNFSRCCILTPNEYFNLHVNELSQKLGLDKIKIYTVEGFYASWIRFLGKNDTYTSDNTRKRTIAKVEPVPDTVSSEKLLNSKMLEELYSRAFYDHIVTVYKDHWKSIIEQLDATGANAILTENGKSIPDYSVDSFKVYSTLKKNITDIISSHAEAITAYDKAKAELESAEKLIITRQKSLDAASETLNNAKMTLVSDLDEAEKKYVASIQTAKTARTNATQAIKKAKEDKAAKFAELKTAEDSLEKIRTERESFKAISYLLSSNSEIAQIILSRLTNEIHLLEEAEAQYKSAPFYNFGKRSRAKAEMDKAAAAFAHSVDEITDEYYSEHSTALGTLRKDIAELDAVITVANQVLASTDEDKTTKNALAATSKCRDLFTLEAFPDIESKMKQAELDYLPDFSKVYRVCYKNVRESESLLRSSERQRDNNSATIEKVKGSIIQPEVISALKTSASLVEQLDFSTLSTILEKEIKAVYTKYGQHVRKGVSYRHALLYKLLLCSLYYDYRTDTPYFINIDEAQDLADIEYVLLRRIHGPKTTFNLYGDVNQLVYSYKGITQWDDIADEITPNLYFLNENYRNTLQITAFCNKEFEADVLGIGLNGEEVKSLAFKDAIHELLQIKEKIPECRVAILYRKGLTKVFDALSEYKSEIVFDKIDTKKISVITVEESKGLEFEAVVVIASQMTMNEKYISYTRALDNLIITDLPGSEIETEDVVDAIIAEESAGETTSEAASEETEQNKDPAIETSEELVHEPKAELPAVAINIRISDGQAYINSFFSFDSELKSLFCALVNEASTITPGIMIRVSTQYIGLAKQNEKCRVYVALDKGVPFIKYQHLLSKELFTTGSLEHYAKAYHQCCQYIDKYPDTIRLKNGDK